MNCEIRLLPMSQKEEFPNMSYKEIQQTYFLNRLPKNQHGYYYFRNVGMVCPSGSLILFQINGKIIASAILERIEKFKVPKNDIYKGAFVFYSNSICTFSPIVAEELSSIDPSFKSFSQVKQKLDVTKMAEIVELIKSKQQIACN